MRACTPRGVQRGVQKWRFVRGSRRARNPMAVHPSIFPATVPSTRPLETGGPCPISPRFGDPSRRVGFIGGLLAMYELCRAHPLVPVDSGRRLLKVVIECLHRVQRWCLSGTSHIRRIGQIRLSPNRAAGLPIVTRGHAFIQNVRRDHYVAVNPECDTFRDRAVRHCRAGSHGPSPRTGFLPVPPLARGKTYR